MINFVDPGISGKKKHEKFCFLAILALTLFFLVLNIYLKTQLSELKKENVFLELSLGDVKTSSESGSEIPDPDFFSGDQVRLLDYEYLNGRIEFRIRICDYGELSLFREKLDDSFLISEVYENQDKEIICKFVKGASKNERI